MKSLRSARCFTTSGLIGFYCLNPFTGHRRNDSNRFSNRFKGEKQGVSIPGWMDKKDYGDDVDEKVEIEELRKGIIAHCNFSILAFKGVYSIFLWCRFHQFNLITWLKSTSTLWCRFVLYLKQIVKAGRCFSLSVCKSYVRDLELLMFEIQWGKTWSANVWKPPDDQASQYDCANNVNHVNRALRRLGVAFSLANIGMTPGIESLMMF